MSAATTGGNRVATEANLPADERIGGYKYIRTMMPGQNSTIAEVLQEATGKRFALKQLLASRVHDASERRSFEFEARLGMELRHPNLIRVVEYIKDREGPYFVMEYFPSEHLRLLLNKKADWVRSKLHRIIEQSTSALTYMHDHGWVHRDIKPENILVNKTAEVRVIDYALAKKVPAGLSRLLGSKPPCEGTHTYMSPEQIRRDPPAVTSDIYSMGITCYELAAGRPPFRANSPGELLNKHIREQPMPPTVYNRNITAEFSDLVLQMIRKNPAERPTSLREVASRFNRIKIFLDDPDPQAGM
jgi:serine/threonine protein kinase